MNHITPAESQGQTGWQGVRSSPNANQKRNPCHVLATGDTLMNSAHLETKVGSQGVPVRVHWGSSGDKICSSSWPLIKSLISPSHPSPFRLPHQPKESSLVLVMRSLVLSHIMPPSYHCSFLWQLHLIFFQGDHPSPIVNSGTWTKLTLLLENRSKIVN